MIDDDVGTLEVAEHKREQRTSEVVIHRGSPLYKDGWTHADIKAAKAAVSAPLRG